MNMIRVMAVAGLCTLPFLLFAGSSEAVTASNLVNGTNSSTADSSTGSAMMHRAHARRVMERRMRRYTRQQRRMQGM